jgi:hypothetical protein
MARKKKIKEIESQEPIIVEGNHSTRIEYPDGSVDFKIHWDRLDQHVQQALTEYEKLSTINLKLKKPRKSKNAA